MPLATGIQSYAFESPVEDFWLPLMFSIAKAVENIWTTHKERPPISTDKNSSELCSIQNEIPIDNAVDLRFAILAIGLYFRKDFEESLPDAPRDYIKLLYICMENEKLNDSRGQISTSY